MTISHTSKITRFVIALTIGFILAGVTPFTAMAATFKEYQDTLREGGYLNSDNSLSPTGITFLANLRITNYSPATWGSLSLEQQEQVLRIIRIAATEDPVSQGCGFLWLKCLWNNIVTTLAFIPAGIGAWFLTTVGQLFNFLVENTIVDFKGTLQELGDLEDSIDLAWSGLRDIANIVIIGMFVFIAISLILGLKEYGERKMIARVLIVAVLINFSLLFTKLIIDASNFFAYQFYYAATEIPKGSVGDTITTEVVTEEVRLEREAAGETVESEREVQAAGIAGVLLSAMRITSVGGVWDSLHKAQAGAFGSAAQTILMGIFLGIMFFLAGAVFLYGSFILITRALLLIFLMVVSPLAFASYLIPKFANEGWHAWWDALLRTAVFAPLLMIFIWMSLLITTEISATDLGLGALMEDPGAGIGISALFSYVLVLGLLFMSIKLASKFAHTISGFAATGGFVGTAALTPLVGASRVAGLAARSSIGAGGLAWAYGTRKRSERKEEAAREFNQRVAALGPRGQALAKKKGIDISERKYSPGMLTRANITAGKWLGKKRFDVAATKPIKSALEAGGAIVFGEKWGEKGISGVRERRAEAAIKSAREMGYESEKKTAERVEREISAKQQVERERLEMEKKMHEATERGAESQRKPAEDEARTRLAAERTETPEASAKRLAEMKNNKGQIESDMNIQSQRLANAVLIDDPTKRKLIEDAAKAERVRLSDELKSLNTNIGTLTKELGEFDEAVRHSGETAVKTANETAAAGKTNITERIKALDAEKKQGGEAAGKSISDVVVAKKIALTSPRNFYNFSPRNIFLRKVDVATDPVAQLIAKAARKVDHKEDIHHLMEAMKHGDETKPKTAKKPPTGGGGKVGGDDHGHDDHAGGEHHDEHSK